MTILFRTLAGLALIALVGVPWTMSLLPEIGHSPPRYGA